MYYLVDNDPNQRYESVEDVLDICVCYEYYEDDVDGFEEYLDDGNSVDVCGYNFNPSEILRELNSDAYQNELRYWAESRMENAKSDYEYDLERACNGEEVWVCDHRVCCYEDSEEEEEENGADTDGDEELIFMLKERIRLQQEAEAKIIEENKKTENEFLSALGIQVI